MSTTNPFRRLAAELYTAADLATLLQVSKRQVWRMHAANELPAAVKLGRLTRWPRPLIDRWVADGCPARRRSAGR